LADTQRKIVFLIEEKRLIIEKYQRNESIINNHHSEQK